MSKGIGIGKFIDMIYADTIWTITDDAELVERCIIELNENDFAKYRQYKNEMNNLRECLSW